VWSEDCGVRSVECGVWWSVGCGVWSVECGVWRGRRAEGKVRRVAGGGESEERGV